MKSAFRDLAHAVRLLHGAALQEARLASALLAASFDGAGYQPLVGEELSFVVTLLERRQVELKERVLELRERAEDATADPELRARFRAARGVSIEAGLRALEASILARSTVLTGARDRFDAHTRLLLRVSEVLDRELLLPALARLLKHLGGSANTTDLVPIYEAIYRRHLPTAPAHTDDFLALSTLRPDDAR